jgi:hypothetical protein
MAVSDYNCGITNDHNAIINATFMYLDKVKNTLLTDDELVECYAIIGQMWASIIEQPYESNFSAHEVKPPQVKAPEVKPPQVKAPEVKPPQVKAPEVKSPQVKAPEVKAPEVKAPEVKAPEVKAPEVKAPEVKAPETKAKVTFQAPLTSLSEMPPSIQLKLKGEFPPPSGSIQLKAST